MRSDSLFGKKKGFFMHIPIDIHRSLKSLAAIKKITMARLITKVFITYLRKEQAKH